MRDALNNVKKTVAHTMVTIVMQNGCDTRAVRDVHDVLAERKNGAPKVGTLKLETRPLLTIPKKQFFANCLANCLAHPRGTLRIYRTQWQTP